MASNGLSDPYPPPAPSRLQHVGSPSPRGSQLALLALRIRQRRQLGVYLGIELQRNRSGQEGIQLLGDCRRLCRSRCHHVVRIPLSRGMRVCFRK